MSELPDGWVETDIGTVGRYINGRGFKESEWRSEGTPIIRIQNLTNEYAAFNYSTAGHEHKYRVEDGDLLVAWAATLGVYRWDRGPAWLNQHIFRVEAEAKLITNDFLYYALKQAIDGLYARAHGSGMVHIKRGCLNLILCPCRRWPNKNESFPKSTNSSAASTKGSGRWSGCGGWWSGIVSRC